MGTFEDFQKRIRASERIIAESDLYYRAICSPSGVQAPQNIAERLPSSDAAGPGGETMSPADRQTGDQRS